VSYVSYGHMYPTKQNRDKGLLLSRPYFIGHIPHMTSIIICVRLEKEIASDRFKFWVSLVSKI